MVIVNMERDVGTHIKDLLLKQNQLQAPKFHKDGTQRLRMLKMIKQPNVGN